MPRRNEAWHERGGGQPSMSGSGCSDLSETNTKGEGATEALKPRRYARGEFQCPPPDDTVPAPKPGGAGYRFVKRAFDICFSAGVCAVLAVPVAAVCAAICVDVH